MSGRNWQQWTPDELATLRRMYEAGELPGAIAAELGRSIPSVSNQISMIRAAGARRKPGMVRAPDPDAVVLSPEKREWKESEGGAKAELHAIVSQPIKTLDALARVCEIDETLWTITHWHANAYQAAAKGADGRMHATTLYQVKASMARKAPLENPALMLAAVEKGLARLVTAKAAPRVWVKRSTKVLRLRAITDLHMGGHAWHRSTGGDSWNLEKSVEVAHASNAYLDTHENTDATESCLAFLGDLGHYETKAGATSSGTLLDMDSRADLMIQSVIGYVIPTIEREAERRPTTVFVLEGNHSGMLDKMLRQMALLYFAKHKNVTVIDQYTPRQFLRWHANLLGFTHGEKAPAKLAELMPTEAAHLWTGATLKEIHKGHFHHEGAKQKLHQVRDSMFEPTVTHAGVVVRQHMAMTPPDQYHVEGGWVGAQQGMSDWYYHEAGAMIGSVIATPRVLELRRSARAA